MGVIRDAFLTRAIEVLFEMGFAYLAGQYEWGTP